MAVVFCRGHGRVAQSLNAIRYAGGLPRFSQVLLFSSCFFFLFLMRWTFQDGKGSGDTNKPTDTLIPLHKLPLEMNQKTERFRRVAMLNYLRDVVDSRVGVNSILSQSIQELKIQKFM